MRAEGREERPGRKGGKALEEEREKEILREREGEREEREREEKRKGEGGRTTREGGT